MTTAKKRQPTKPKSTTKAATGRSRRGHGVVTAHGDLAVLERKARMLAMRKQKMSYRDIAEREGIHPSIAYRQIAEAAANLIPDEDIDTVRRMELEALDDLLRRWLPIALGEGKEKVEVDGVAIEVSVPLERSIKASAHVLQLMERKWKWVGLEAAPTGKPDVNGMNEKDLDGELWQLIESIKTAAALAELGPGASADE